MDKTLVNAQDNQEFRRELLLLAQSLNSRSFATEVNQWVKGLSGKQKKKVFKKLKNIPILYSFSELAAYFPVERDFSDKNVMVIRNFGNNATEKIELRNLLQQFYTITADSKPAMVFDILRTGQSIKGQSKSKQKKLVISAAPKPKPKPVFFFHEAEHLKERAIGQSD